MWRISERRIEAIQMPVRGTKVALQHLPLQSTRKTTLRAQDGLLLVIEQPSVVGLLEAIATVIRTVLC